MGFESSEDAGCDGDAQGDGWDGGYVRWCLGYILRIKTASSAYYLKQVGKLSMRASRYRAGNAILQDVKLQSAQGSTSCRPIYLDSSEFFDFPLVILHPFLPGSLKLEQQISITGNISLTSLLENMATTRPRSPDSF
jgi:hypothetical protein